MRQECQFFSSCNVDIEVATECVLLPDLHTGKMTIDVNVLRNDEKKDLSFMLLAPTGRLLWQETISASENQFRNLTATIENAPQWSSETPDVCLLEILADGKTVGNARAVFCRSELCGEKFMVNGRETALHLLDLSGIAPESLPGYLSVAKCFNANAVNIAGSDPAIAALCDELGLYTVFPESAAMHRYHPQAMAADRQEDPGLYAFKYLSQTVKTELLDKNTGRISIHNCRQFSTLDDLEMVWFLECDGQQKNSGKMPLNGIAPGTAKEFLLNVEAPAVLPGEKIVLTVRFNLKNSTSWAKAGHEIAHESFILPPAMLKARPADPELFTGFRADASSCIMSAGKLSCVAEAEGIKQLKFNGDPLLLRGPRLAIWRAPVGNESKECLDSWSDRGLDRAMIFTDRFITSGNAAECHALALPEDNEADELEFTQRIYPRKDGALCCEFIFVVPESFDDLPRLGVSFELPEKFGNISYFGRGPHENYPDGKVSAIPGCYSKYGSLSTPYSVPRENGGRCDVEFAAFRDGEMGCGLLAVSESQVSFSALEYSVKELCRARDGKKSSSGGTIHVNWDLRVRGTAENVTAANTIRAGRYRMTLLFKALEADENAAQSARLLRLPLV